MPTLSIYSGARLASVAAVLALTTACSDLTALKQSNPGQLSAGTIYVPANATLLVNGAISDGFRTIVQPVASAGATLQTI